MAPALEGAARGAAPSWCSTGHSHTYERFAPMTETGATSAAGLRQIVVGTGGEEHHPIASGERLRHQPEA